VNGRVVRRPFRFAQAALLVAGMIVAPRAQADTAPASPAPTARYDVVDLGVIDRLAADIVPGLSASGKIVSWRQVESQTYSAVLVDGAVQKLLAPPTGYRNTFAYSVNDRGDAVGWSNTTANPVDSASTVHAVLFDEQGVRDLGTLGGRRSRAYAINDSDVVVGVSELANSKERAFRYSGGEMRPLDPLPGGTYSAAFDINDAGAIVGGSGVPSSSSRPLAHAVLWEGNEPKDLGTLDGSGNSVAYAINERGEVTGVSDVLGEETVFLYRRGKMLDLGIRGHAFAINDEDQIVGSLTPPERGQARGFLWKKNVVTDINELIAVKTYRIEAAYRINDRGQIVCSGVGNGRLHMLLLNPLDLPH